MLYWQRGGGRCLSVYQRQSVVDMRGVCSRGRGSISEIVATDHHQKIKWTPMSGGGGRGDDGLGIRKY